MTTQWYQMKHEACDVVVSSRIRLARNCRDLPFPCRMTIADRQTLSERVQAALEQGHFTGNLAFTPIDMGKLSDEEALALVETHGVSPDFAHDCEGKSLLLSADASVSIMVGEEDHLRIQILGANQCLTDCLTLANQIDDLLDEALHFAFDEKLGYLTQCPTNLGTGLRASLMLHLPALETNGGMNRLAGNVQKLGLALRGTFGEGSGAKGSLYQLSNQVTLGISEEAAISNLTGIANQLIEQERRARTALADRTDLIDQIWRAFGICKYARSLSMDEFRQYASLLRLGISLGLFETLEYETIDTLVNTLGAGSIMSAAQKPLDAAARDQKRAETVRESL